MAGDRADLVFAGIAEQARLLRAGDVSSCDLVAATLQRIEDLDPLLGAFRVVLADQALTEAHEADVGRARGDDRPLLGVPIAVKDDMDLAGEVTAWGTGAYGAPKSRDSEVVTRLRAAGAIVVGKTNVPEMTLWPWTASKTWGVTRNPWDVERTPGGSSGGAAVAVAAGMCGAAFGSDGGGSIRYPSALTGVFGLKPQRDRIPLGPDHVDAWNGLIAYGPLTHTVRDAALLLDCTGDDLPAGGFVRALDAPVTPLRIAVSYAPPSGSFARLSDDRRAAIEATAELLRSCGHEVFDQQVDYGRVLANTSVRYFAGVERDVATLPHPEQLERATRRAARVGARMSARRVASARAKEQVIAASMNRSFERADVVLTPIAGGPAPRNADVAPRGLARSFLRSNVMAWASPWNAIGQPAASVPVGFDDDGLPLAAQLCGKVSDEATLLRVAAQLEEARPWAHHRPLVGRR